MPPKAKTKTFSYDSTLAQGGCGSREDAEGPSLCGEASTAPMTTADMLDNDDVRQLLEFLVHDNRQGDALFEEAEAGQDAGGAHNKSWKVSNGYFERFCDRVESTLADKELGWVELICDADFEFRDPGGLNLQSAMETLSAPTASLTGAMLRKQGA